jgi:hypothetical protein
MSLPSVSVVIPTYRRRDALPRVIAAISADPYPSEIIVVVDGCFDGSYQLLLDLAQKEPRLRPVWRENGGDAVARQTGVEQASGDVVLLLDDDVLAGPGLAHRHAAIHARMNDLVVLGYMPTEYPDTRRPGAFATYLYAQEYEQVCAGYERDPTSILTSLWAGNVSLRREDALRVGLAGAERLGYHGDQAFGLRCRRAGLTGVFDRSLLARHAHIRDIEGFARQARQQGSDRRILIEQHPEAVSEGSLRDHLPPLVRFGVAVAAAPSAHRVVAPMLRGSLRCAGRARLWQVETNLARLLRQVELRYGYRASRSAAGPPR